MIKYSLRNATINDLRPMMAIGHEGLRPHIEAFKPWDQAAEEQGFRAHFTPDCIEIIQANGQDIGYLKIETAADHIYLDGIYIAASHRGLGIGGRVIQDKIDTFKANVLPLRLRVYKTNPAQSLYARLGFSIAEEVADAYLMEYRFG